MSGVFLWLTANGQPLMVNMERVAYVATCESGSRLVFGAVPDQTAMWQRAEHEVYVDQTPVQIAEMLPEPQP